MLWTKRGHQRTIFHIFESSNESSPNSSCHFWNNKVMVYSSFASLFSVMKDNSSVFLSLKPCILWTKRAYQKEIFRLLSGWVKIHQIPHVIFETTRSWFIQVLHHCSVSWKITLLYFCPSNLVYFGQKEPIKKKFSDFWVVGWKFIKFLMSYLKSQFSFSLNFESLFIVMKEILQYFFSWSFIWFGQKEPIKAQNFRLSTARRKVCQICSLTDSFCWK